MLVKLLSVAALFAGIHDDILGGHERKLGHYTLAYDLFVDNKSVFRIGNVEHYVEYRINAQECFRHGDALVCRVVKSPLEPLCTCGECRVENVAHNVSCQGAYPLVTHRVSLVSHSRRAYLCLFKRLLYLFEGL